MEEKESTTPMLPQNGTESRAEGAKLPQFLNTVAAALTVFVVGSAIGWASPALPYLLDANSILPITPHEASWIGSLIAIGALIGALPAGTVADLIGRKRFILTLSFPFITSWAMVYFARSASILYVARLIAGVSVGAACVVVPMYITEIAEDNVRGVLGMAFPGFTSSGLLATAFIPAFFSFQILNLFCATSAIVALIGAILLVETPFYYIKKGNLDEAEKCFMKLRGPSFNARKEVEYLANNLFDSNAPKISFGEAIKTRQSKRAILMSFGIMFFHQCSGISIMSFFGGTIIRDTKVMEPEMGNLISTAVSISALLFTPIAVAKAGRRTLLQITIVGCGMCLAYLGYFFHVKSIEEPSSLLKILSLVSMCVFGFTYHMGIGPIPWLMIHEILPPNVKGIASGWITGFNWILAFGTTKLFHPLLDSIGPAATFWVFACICIIGCIFFTFFIIETKGKTLVEIQRELERKKMPKKQ